jgi:N-methylhydantoinase B
VIVRPGSVLQPRFPAPLGMRGVTMMRNMAACLGLLNVATGRPGAMAAHSAYVIWYLRGRDDEGELFLLSDGLGVGYGRTPDRRRQRRRLPGGAGELPAEFLDSVFPVRVRRYAINPDTGGPGAGAAAAAHPRDRGAGARGHGVDAHRQRRASAWGVAGGHAAGTGACVVNPGAPDERCCAL